jgi:hypothetical protein
VGLDAFVYCRCWQDGLATPPPAEPIGLDEDGYLDLLLPWEGNESAHNAFGAWMKEACSHERMEQAREHLSNWAGLRLFQEVLPADLVTLRTELPNANGGSMPPAQAARMLDELDAFTDRAPIADEVVLVDEASDRFVMTYVAAYEGVAMLGPGYRAGVDPDGFFVLDPDAQPPATLFRAARFAQRVLPGGEVEFSADGQRATIAMPPVREHGTEPPHRLAVQARPRSTAYFEYIVTPLRRLCEASLATGNPVMWT